MLPALPGVEHPGVEPDVARTKPGCIVLGGAIKREAKQNYQVPPPSATLT